MNSCRDDNFCPVTLSNAKGLRILRFAQNDGSRGGSVLLIVAIISILISSIAISALVITARSRQASLRYSYNISTYDLAVSVNEMILIYLNRIIDANRPNSTDYFMDILRPMAASTHITIFEFRIESKNGHIIRDTYRADTILRISDNGFTIRTDLFVNPGPLHLVNPRTRVEARLIWEKNLDEYRLIMIESMRVIFPTVQGDEPGA